MAITSHCFSCTLTRTVGYGYLLSLPRGYEAAPDRRWPAILFLHGAGERGADLRQLGKHGPPKLLLGTAPLTPAEQAAARVLAEEFIVIAPQCPADERWDSAALAALLDHVTAGCRLDPRRVCLTGMSMGGYGAWSLGICHPDRFAALAPICGGGETIDLILATGPRRAALARLAIWIFHGAKDPVVPLAESERMVAALQRAALPAARLTVYPVAQHDAWTETYANAALYAWFLEHESPRDAAAP